MKKKSIREIQKQRREGRIAIIIVTSILAIFLFLLLVLPLLLGGRMLSQYVNKIHMDSLSCVILQNPRYPSALMPTPVEAVLEGDEAEALVSRFIDMADDFTYDGDEYVVGGLWSCYMRVDSGGSVAFFYITEDFVRVEKNSTYYSFSPKTNEGKAAYAEWYAEVLAYIDEAAN